MSLQSDLSARAGSKCELCESTESLTPLAVAPYLADAVDHAILACATCTNQVNGEELDPNHWYCLQGAIWSEVPGVQVTSWRLLKRLGEEQWAVDLLDQAYLADDVLAWAKDGFAEADERDPCFDSNGARLSDGDNVTLIKDLVVKGANFTAKRGTLVRGIRLTNNPEHVEGKVNKTQIVLVSKFLKKA